MDTIKPIRLFADAHVFDNEYQGTRTFLKELYLKLSVKENLRVFLGAYDVNNVKNNFPPDSGITFIPYNNKSAFTRLLINIPFILKKYQIDFAHFQYIIPPVKYCRYIVTIHDMLFRDFPGEFPFPYRLLRNFLFKQAAAKADMVTTVSAYSKQSIEKYLPVKNGPVKMIPNGVNEIYFQPYDKQQSKRIIREKYGIGNFILYVSRFEPRKNHESLLKSYLELKLYEQGYFLVLLGHKSLRVKKFDNLLNDVPGEIRKYIFISQAINDAELLAFYQSASVFVYPSRLEGFGISPLEAAALKIPVICSNKTAMKDYSFFGDGHIDPDDHNLLQKK